MMTEENEKTNVDVVNMDVVQLLPTIAKGACIYEYNIKFEELIEAVRETNAAGKITLTLQIKPLKKGDASAVGLDYEVSIKAPRLETACTIFFPTRTNTLVRNDPRQTELEF
ncbi:MAG: hypothetical protein EOM20_14665 [Spartobacteria bacterium]|nr:hypothetical protein [Spartobacteria bacterium]